MVSIWSIVIGAVVALAGGAVSALLAPWIARRAARADTEAAKDAQRRLDLREAIEGFLGALFDLDSEMNMTYLRQDAGETDIEDDEVRLGLQRIQRMQLAEAHLGLLLTKDQQPIYTMAVYAAQLLLDRPTRGEEGPGLLPLRAQIITRFARWHNGEETPLVAQQEFETFVQNTWMPSVHQAEQAAEGRPKS